jgi:hypothetical protein
VVIAIVAVLIGLLLPAIEPTNGHQKRVVEAGRRIGARDADPSSPIQTR